MDKKKIALLSSDGEAFEVDAAVAMVSKTIEHMVEFDCAEDTIPLPNVTSRILVKVIEYCQKHVLDDPAKSSDDKAELKSWDDNFVKVDQATLFELISCNALIVILFLMIPKDLFCIDSIFWCIQAANYMDIKGLLDLLCQSVADMITGKTPKEIRKTFNIKNDFTPEEEEKVRRESQWAFE
ncbi:hypothetical protein ZIOFF_036414 [Zingiber officinale]|uniref:SKP1-like protein n=1 Tax=Zingiber officinale TaxID=94328 RepID=A0A8J5L8L0_ZINOF|nr:hypothetical protein ZIOFF_036414 [Zingiber officinale]